MVMVTWLRVVTGSQVVIGLQVVMRAAVVSGHEVVLEQEVVLAKQVVLELVVVMRPKVVVGLEMVTHAQHQSDWLEAGSFRTGRTPRAGEGLKDTISVLMAQACRGRTGARPHARLTIMGRVVEHEQPAQQQNL